MNELQEARRLWNKHKSLMDADALIKELEKANAEMLETLIEAHKIVKHSVDGYPYGIKVLNKIEEIIK